MSWSGEQLWIHTQKQLLTKRKLLWVPPGFTPHMYIKIKFQKDSAIWNEIAAFNFLTPKLCERETCQKRHFVFLMLIWKRRNKSLTSNRMIFFLNLIYKLIHQPVSWVTKQSWLADTQNEKWMLTNKSHSQTIKLEKTFGRIYLKNLIQSREITTVHIVWGNQLEPCLDKRKLATVSTYLCLHVWAYPWRQFRN